MRRRRKSSLQFADRNYRNNNSGQLGKKIGWFVLGLLALAMIVFSLWCMLPFGAMTQAMDAVISDQAVNVTEDINALSFESTTPNGTGIVLYPGARVSAAAYAPLARRLALEGIQVYVAKFPLKMAVLKGNAANSIIKANPEITTWYVSGHSLGGTMACSYYASHQDQVAGIILLASYPMKSLDLTNTKAKVLSLSGQNDGFATPEDITASKLNLPASSIFFQIPGGNHEQFGYYGHQKGDGIATITRDEQMEIIFTQIMSFLGPKNK